MSSHVNARVISSENVGLRRSGCIGLKFTGLKSYILTVFSVLFRDGENTS